jgi:ferredoxin
LRALRLGAIYSDSLFAASAALPFFVVKFLYLFEGICMKITIDRTKCEGYAKCLQASPKVFKLDAKMIAEVIDPKADSDEKILFAARICPTKAISVEEEGTGKKLYPPD